MMNQDERARMRMALETILKERGTTMTTNETKNEKATYHYPSLRDYIHYECPEAGVRKGYAIFLNGAEVAQGASKPEVTKHFFDVVEAAFQGSYTPAVLIHEGNMVVIWREPDKGWIYAVRPLLSWDEKEVTNFECALTREDAAEYAREKLARRALEEGGDIESALSILPSEKQEQFRQDYEMEREITSIMQRDRCSRDIAQETLQAEMLAAWRQMHHK